MPKVQMVPMIIHVTVDTTAITYEHREQQKKAAQTRQRMVIEHIQKGAQRDVQPRQKDSMKDARGFKERRKTRPGSQGRLEQRNGP